MKDGRLILHGALLCLPAVMLSGAVGFFLHDRVPEFVRNEERRVTAEYRAAALELKAAPETATAFPVRGELGERAGKMAPGKGWGHLPRDGRRLVWYDDGKRVLATLVDEIEPFDYQTFFRVAGALVVILFALITFVGVRFFVRYVRDRDEFVSAAAHDLTTPLVGLRRMIGRNDAEARVLNERMILIVENIKAFLRLGGRRPVRPEVFDLAASYAEAYALFRDDFRDLFDGADVAVAGASAPVPVRADPTMTLQVLWNLLGNDLKYAAPYGKVEVRFASERGTVRVEFADEGPGMTRRQAAKAFNRYYRAGKTLGDGRGGFGIGLCTAREFARRMGGDLTVRANRPHGCVFTLTLPAAASPTPSSLAPLAVPRSRA